jgi:pyrophosphatase PpaX
MTLDPSAGKAVLFDMDGTLLDTIPLIIESYQHAFRTCLGHEIDPQAILLGIGTPLDAFFRSRWPDQVDELRQVYLKHNHERLDTNVGIFLEVPAMLDSLDRLGMPMAIVTSKSSYSAKRSLADFQLDHYFKTVIAKESTTRHKPDPEPVFEAMRQLGLAEPDKVVFVGDSLHDLECAKRAGCRSAIVDWTAMPADPLRLASPDLWIRQAGQLADYLNSI